MTLDEARSYALSLPGTTMEPHFERTSFRVRSKIFATAPQAGQSLNVFVGEESSHAAVAEFSAFCELLYWGKRMVGVCITLDEAEPDAVFELLHEAWEIRAPRS